MIKEEISRHKLVYAWLFLVLVSAAFLRLFRLHDLLGFYYDQGRDALVIHRLLHQGKLFLIGPVTGIEGVFLGPFYYYLLAPLYFLGGGSPVFAAACLSWVLVGAILLLFIVGAVFFDRRTGLIAAILYTFSYSLVTFDRWLSHPKLLPLFSLLAVLALFRIYQGREKFWLLLALAVGLGLQLEAASAFFFLPAILLFVFWQGRRIKNWYLIIGALGVFLFTLLPQITFNFRHQGILFASFKKLLIAESSFRLSFWEIARARLNSFFQIFFAKLFYDKQKVSAVFLAVFVGTALWFRKRLLSPGGKILLLWLLMPLLGLLLYQGNFGRVWDYYFAGVYPVFILLVAVFLSWLIDSQAGRLAALAFFLLFFWVNLSQLKIYYRIGIGIILRRQLAAIDWIYQDAGEKEFNVDVYVPPVIPHAYDYLFTWYGVKRYGREPEKERVTLLYTLAEADNSHPERLTAWLDRQAEIGKVIDEEIFGDITVQERERIK